MPIIQKLRGNTRRLRQPEALPLRHFAETETIPRMEHLIAEAAQTIELGLHWREGFQALGAAFYTALPPIPLPSPYLVGLNGTLARELGLDPAVLASPAGVAGFTGNEAIAGTRPVA